jgi:hypothetical protein
MDHKAYIASITLAGAAEEILGQAIGDNAAFSVLKISLSSRFNLPEREVSQGHLNHARNWLKHRNKLKDDETIEIDLEAEAIQYIVRALVNLQRHDNSFPSQSPRFIEWLGKDKLDLFEFVTQNDQIPGSSERSSK